MDFLENFFAEWNGVRCCNGGLCQCVALVNQYAQELGAPIPTGPAAAALNFGPGWKQIDLDLAEPGDVLIYSAMLPGSGGSGHIGILYSGSTTTTFQLFSQNADGRDNPDTGAQGAPPRLDDNYAPGYLWRAYRYAMPVDPTDPTIKGILDRLSALEDEAGKDTDPNLRNINDALGNFADDLVKRGFKPNPNIP